MSAVSVDGDLRIIKYFIASWLKVFLLLISKSPAWRLNSPYHLPKTFIVYQLPYVYGKFIEWGRVIYADTKENFS